MPGQNTGNSPKTAKEKGVSKHAKSHTKVVAAAVAAVAALLLLACFALTRRRGNVIKGNGKFENVRQISVSSRHCAAVTDTGDLYTWGDNEYGQLGDGTQEDRSVPQKIMSNVSFVTTAPMNTACITNDDELYVWGRGYIGDGSGESDCATTPVMIMGDVASVSIASNYEMSCITKNGDLYTWGDNSVATLGIDSGSGPYYHPMMVMSNVADVQISQHTTMVLTTEGDLYSCGMGGMGGLGDGTNDVRRYYLKKIMSNVRSMAYARSVWTAVTEDGDLYAWGYDGNCLLIGGERSSNVPVKIMTNVKDARPYVDIITAITEDGALYNWGVDEAGGIGNGGYSDSSAPVKNNTITNADKLVSGSWTHGCITSDGDLYMWGYNKYGQLGTGETSESVGEPRLVLSNIVDAQAYGYWGDYYFIAVIDTNGDVYTWGKNTDGQLGDGTTTDSTAPIKITV